MKGDNPVAAKTELWEYSTQVRNALQDAGFWATTHLSSSPYTDWNLWRWKTCQTRRSPVSAVEGSICERNEVDGFGEMINDGATRSNKWIEKASRRLVEALSTGTSWTSQVMDGHQKCCIRSAESMRDQDGRILSSTCQEAAPTIQEGDRMRSGAKLEESGENWVSSTAEGARIKLLIGWVPLGENSTDSNVQSIHLDQELLAGIWVWKTRETSLDDDSTQQFLQLSFDINVQDEGQWLDNRGHRVLMEIDLLRVIVGDEEGMGRGGFAWVPFAGDRHTCSWSPINSLQKLLPLIHQRLIYSSALW
ncbi:hypothetical protein D4764_05G0011420 [Takifugu flavidus]|uniref:Uncharacterized protein n=1 Tax=Takifugu flavidus TaxID=433684 RepID=A0A5C6N0Q7_9TELE|nr:hypothetical protein D4764_05G0011420 [Takifugu flavidus]